MAQGMMTRRRLPRVDAERARKAAEYSRACDVCTAFCATLVAYRGLRVCPVCKDRMTRR